MITKLMANEHGPISACPSREGDLLIIHHFLTHHSYFLVTPSRVTNRLRFVVGFPIEFFNGGFCLCQGSQAVFITNLFIFRFFLWRATAAAATPHAAVVFLSVQESFSLPFLEGGLPKVCRYICYGNIVSCLEQHFSNPLTPLATVVNAVLSTFSDVAGPYLWLFLRSGAPCCYWGLGLN